VFLSIRSECRCLAVVWRANFIGWLILRCSDGEKMKTRYRVHRFDIKMATDQSKLEQFLNSLEGEVVAIIPNVTDKPFKFSVVDFLLIVEKVS